MNKQDKSWEEKHRKWFYLQPDHTSSKRNWASWTTYYLQPLSCCRMLPLQIGWQRTESSVESNRPGSSDSISKKTITSNRQRWDAGEERRERLMPSAKRQVTQQAITWFWGSSRRTSRNQFTLISHGSWTMKHSSFLLWKPCFQLNFLEGESASTQV